MVNNKTIIITSSPQITSVTTFFYKIAERLVERNYKVIIIFDKNEVTKYQSNQNVIYKKWPSKRPTKFKDFKFLRQIIKEEKPSYIISSFGAVNVSIIGGFLWGISNRIAWNHTKINQIFKDSNNVWLTWRLLC